MKIKKLFFLQEVLVRDNIRWQFVFFDVSMSLKQIGNICLEQKGESHGCEKI